MLNPYRTDILFSSWIFLWYLLFIFNYTNDGFFNSLSNLVSLSEPNSTVNPTMSKKIIIKYL